MSRCWLNGRVLDAADARIDPADRGFTLGDGLFETLKMRNGQPCHLARHVRRLRHGAAVLGIDVPADDQTIAAALALLTAAGAEAARITLTRGPAARSVLPEVEATPTLLIQCGPYPTPPERVSAILCRTTRRNEYSPLAAIKSLNYLDCILARKEARLAGADDAILLNTAGNVAEASAASVFAWVGGQLCTPRLADGALPGIARGLLIERAGAMERRLIPEDLRTADAVILVNALGVSALGLLEGERCGEAAALVDRLRPCLDDGPA